MKEDDDLGPESSRSALVREDTRKRRKKKTRKKGARADIKSSEDNQEVRGSDLRVPPFAAGAFSQNAFSHHFHIGVEVGWPNSKIDFNTTSTRPNLTFI